MLSIGIVGLPNVGKSTLFKALTKKQIDIQNYPFTTIDPNVGVVAVPDERLELLAKLSHSKKIIPTAIEFIDIAGLVKGASQGEGLGNKFLSHIREVDAIIEVVRDFKNEDITHVAGKVDPQSDIETINLELIMADLQTAENRLQKLNKDIKSGDKKIITEKQILEKIKTQLEAEKPIREIELSAEEAEAAKPYNFLTAKPLLYVFNVDENNGGGQTFDRLPAENSISINAQLEAEIAELPETEQAEYKKAMGISETGLDKLIRSAYEMLNLITYFTSGEPETRAWTVTKNTKAPEAAGVIHTDFIKGFIRAEVVNWRDFIDNGGWSKAKEKGLVKTEGKAYEVRDGDVCYFLIST